MMPAPPESSFGPGDGVDFANRFDRELAGVFERREADWRNGAVVYQVLVDRFAPPADLEAKRHLYPAPKRLREWDEVPVRGEYLEGARLWSHEIDFWGGDLASTRSRLEHIQGLGADVLYLNPIHLAYTNHSYDSLDYAQVAPWFGTRQDVIELADTLHARGMRLVLDGVFNHMGRNSEIFRSAESDPDSPVRDWFDFGDRFPGGVRTWWLAENLPELVMENPAVREYVYAGQDSIVRSYLRDGIDGWRLDVAVDTGFRYLEELTNAAHAQKPGSLVVGEIATYPKEWFPSVDAVMNFALREVLVQVANHRIAPQHALRMIDRLIGEADYEHILKSWIFLENHDTARLATTVPSARARRMAQVLQFTLPGAPNLYYGCEVGMAGGDDPEMRAPMRWDLVTADNPTLAWTRRLVDLHQSHRALRVGQFRTLTTDRLVGFERYTDRIADAVFVLANPSDEEVTEWVQLPDSKLMNPFRMLDLLGDADLRLTNGLLRVTMPPDGFLVLTPETHPAGGYSSYKRVR
jgi:glycosidase